MGISFTQRLREVMLFTVGFGWSMFFVWYNCVFLAFSFKNLVKRVFGDGPRQFHEGQKSEKIRKSSQWYPWNTISLSYLFFLCFYNFTKSSERCTTLKLYLHRVLRVHWMYRTHWKYSSMQSGIKRRNKSQYTENRIEQNRTHDISLFIS